MSYSTKIVEPSSSQSYGTMMALFEVKPAYFETITNPYKGYRDRETELNYVDKEDQCW